MVIGRGTVAISMRAIFLLACVSVAVVLPAASQAQILPTEPVRVFDGRLIVTGEASLTAGREDHEAYFNYTDYERNALRTIRLAVGALWQPLEQIAFVGELRSEDFSTAGAYAAYIRVRPWRTVRFDVQAGRIPPVFGAFSRHIYSSDRFLIGYPLAYQYLTSLRGDAVPGNADDLLFMRGRGWRSSFPVGSHAETPGVPVVSAFRWDTGVQARWTNDTVDAAVAVTTGTLSRPRIADDNDSKQVAVRVALRPTAGLVLGASASRGGWISRQVPLAANSDDLQQLALGADAEYSRAYWVLRGELVWSQWRVPFATAPPQGDEVSALGAWIEGRYRVSPRWYVAGRADRLGFSSVTGSMFDGRATAWDAPVIRYEAGGGYYIRRNIVARATTQWNHRDSARARSRTFLSAQVSYWF
jgi:hypothetical protein